MITVLLKNINYLISLKSACFLIVICVKKKKTNSEMSICTKKFSFQRLIEDRSIGCLAEFIREKMRGYC